MFQDIRTVTQLFNDVTPTVSQWVDFFFRIALSSTSHNTFVSGTGLARSRCRPTLALRSRPTAASLTTLLATPPRLSRPRLTPGLAWSTTPKRYWFVTHLECRRHEVPHIIFLVISHKHFEIIRASMCTHLYALIPFHIFCARTFIPSILWFTTSKVCNRLLCWLFFINACPRYVRIWVCPTRRA